MALLRHFLLASLCFCIFTAQSTDPSGLFYCDTDSRNLTAQTSTDILKMLTKLVTVVSRDGGGYATAAHGAPANKVFGLAQCRGDVSAEDCSSCLQDAARGIRIRCPDHLDARIWNEYCFLRYNGYEFFGILDTTYGYLYLNDTTVPDPTRFNKKLKNLVDEITKQAVSPENKGLGKGKTKLSTSLTLYALVQCTRDLSPEKCALCVATAVGENFWGNCKDTMGCRVLYSSCYVRYEVYPFYFPRDPPENSIVSGTETRD